MLNCSPTRGRGKAEDMVRLYALAALLALLATATVAAAQDRVLEADLGWETLASLRAKGFTVQDLGRFPPVLTMDGAQPRQIYRAYSRGRRQVVDCLVWDGGAASRCWIVTDHRG
jgi:hypothetical protein